jgi:DNA repair protein RadC
MLTKRLVEAGLLLGITVLDHIILGDGNEVYYSFADEQLL